MKIAIANDHAGTTLKNSITKTLEAMSHTVVNLGTDGADSVDYPDFGHAMANALKEQKAEMGVLICGSGIGISIAANRHPHVRAALCHNVETATLSRQHNDANVLALGARIVDEATAVACVKAFFTTAFEGGRHQKRVEKLG